MNIIHAVQDIKGLKESTTPSGRLTFIIIHARLIHISGVSVRVSKRSKIRDRGQMASRFRTRRTTAGV